MPLFTPLLLSHAARPALRVLRPIVAAWGLLLAAVLASTAQAHGAMPDDGDTLAKVRARGRLIWGGDAEGGGPYVYPDPANPRGVTGFEVELAQALAAELGVRAEFFQAPWDDLPALLDTRQIDVVLNGYELTPTRAARMDCTSPYYIYRLTLLKRKGDERIGDWPDLARPLAGRRFKVGALNSSGAYGYASREFGNKIELKSYDANTDALREVENDKLDATVVDLPIARFYEDQFPGLEPAGQPIESGYYVMFVRQGDEPLRAALDAALGKILASGRLEEIYNRYGLWNADQDRLASLAGKSPADLRIRASRLSPWQVLVERGPLLLQGAGMTVFLACASMPLAILLGLAIALGRVYGPAPLRWLAIGYVEVIRGTPLLLQLYVLFYLLPQLGFRLGAVKAAIAGLAINYSAYEAEIYRAGLKAIPRGQMEAALALGMTTAQALRRIIVPQAVRIVIPPVTNDFIALFKDTSVCSVITVVELTGAYRMQRNDTLAVGELALLTAALYLVMSVPLSHLASRLERRFGRARTADG
jgi:polar amino acid transport system substrate-binding protein